MDQDVQMFFARDNAMLDASIAAWHAKLTVRAGTGRVEHGAVPRNDLRLSWTTFSVAADEDARIMGRAIGTNVGDRARASVTGIA